MIDEYEIFDSIIDEKTFIIFCKYLLKDKQEDSVNENNHPSSPYGPTKNGWENITIEAFIEAAIAWAEDSDFGKTQNLNVWQKFAQFMLAGKSYE